MSLVATEHPKQTQRLRGHALHRRSLSSLVLPSPSCTDFAVFQVVGRAYDFFYLRCDYSNDCNVGCASLLARRRAFWLASLTVSASPGADGFVNFTSTTSLLAFAKARLGTRWNKCGSDKLCVMSYANIQVRLHVPVVRGAPPQ